VGDVVERRLADLAGAFGRKGQIVFI
jgi:hypothetical protein